MEKRLFRLSVIGFVFVGILGSLGHFVYEWSGYMSSVGAFFPVNESTWEHLKLLFLPYLIYTIIEYILLKRRKGLIFSKSIGVVSGMLSIVALFYTYTGITGQSNGIFNILIFFIGVLIAFFTDYILIKKKNSHDALGIAVFISLLLVFIAFTFLPPLIPLFRDPINFSYGI